MKRGLRFVDNGGPIGAAPRRAALIAAIGPLLSALSGLEAFSQTDPLPSWNDGAVKKSITDFVAKVTTQGDADLVPPEQRIGVFDNDGTLWCEQPNYFQAAFTLDRVKAMAAQHPEWKQQQPFKAFLSGDRKALAEQGEKGLLTLVAAAHSGMTTDEFAKSVADWFAPAKHPRFNRPYNELIYQPMVELLAYLRANASQASSTTPDAEREYAYDRQSKIARQGVG
jgi:hypothetical protein